MFISAQDSLSKAVLSTEDREDLKQKQFALPKKAEDKEEKGESGNYPIPDLSHARNALAMVARYGSSSEQAKVRAAVYKKYPELDKRKEEEHEKSMFISAKDSLMKGKVEETEKEEKPWHWDDIMAYAKEALKKKSLNKASPTEERYRRRQALEGLDVKKAGVEESEDKAGIEESEDKDEFDKAGTPGDPFDIGPISAPTQVQSLGKSVDPVLAARQNQVPISMIGAMGRPVVGQTGFQNGMIKSNFQEGGFTLEDNSPRKLGNPRSK